MLERIKMFKCLEESKITYCLCYSRNSRHKAGTPKINIMSASKYGTFKFLLPEFSQIIFSPGPLIFKLRSL